MGWGGWRWAGLLMLGGSEWRWVEMGFTLIGVALE